MEPECAAWREKAVHRIEELKPAAVILSNSAGYVHSEGVTEGSTDELSAGTWGDGMRSMLSSIAATHSVPIILSDVPRPGFNVPVCLSRARQHARPDSACAVQRSQAVNSDLRSAESVAASSVPTTRVVDLADKFCDGNVCPNILSGTVLYRDTNHITTAAAKMLEPALDEKLSAIVPTAHQ
jgi:hypothetical protein